MTTGPILANSSNMLRHIPIVCFERKCDLNFAAEREATRDITTTLFVHNSRCRASKQRAERKLMFLKFSPIKNANDVPQEINNRHVFKFNIFNKNFLRHRVFISFYAKSCRNRRKILHSAFQQNLYSTTVISFLTVAVMVRSFVAVAVISKR